METDKTEMSERPKRPLLRYFGGKWRTAPWLISHFPPHQVYTEVYGGGAGVLLRKPRSYAEVYNDLDGEMVNLFQVMRDQADQLVRLIELTPFARDEFDLSFVAAQSPLEQARRTLVRSYMGYGSTMTRRCKSGRLMRTGFREYSKKARGSIPAHDWRTWPNGAGAIAQRLRGVIIENRPAIDVLLKHDGAETLHYVDPPYLHELRGRSDGYTYEMTEVDHRTMAEVLHSLKGKVLLSAYDCALYNTLFADWRTDHLQTHADGARSRVEIIWMNY